LTGADGSEEQLGRKADPKNHFDHGRPVGYPGVAVSFFEEGQRMETAPLRLEDRPRLHDGTLILALSGWMDGGEVSTGTLDWLVRSLEAKPIAEIAPSNFYLFNFPGTMEVAALFRPHIQIVDGLVKTVRPPANRIYCDVPHNLLLFSGSEPNLNWEQFGECLFSLCLRTGVRMIYFVGSYAGMVPHTREPRISTTVSHSELKPILSRYGISFSNYEGPGSFASFMTSQAPRQGLQMASIVAEIPSYVQGINPKAIEAVARKLVALLGLPLELEDLRRISDTWESRVGEALHSKSELLELINKMEEAYDQELFDTQLGDLKDWLEGQGIRLE